MRVVVVGFAMVGAVRQWVGDSVCVYAAEVEILHPRNHFGSGGVQSSPVFPTRPFLGPAPPTVDNDEGPYPWRS